jgi:hypothetical protein
MDKFESYIVNQNVDVEINDIMEVISNDLIRSANCLEQRVNMAYSSNHVVNQIEINDNMEIVSNGLIRNPINLDQQVNMDYTPNNNVPQIDNVEMNDIMEVLLNDLLRCANVEQNALNDLIGVFAEPIMNCNAEMINLDQRVNMNYFPNNNVHRIDDVEMNDIMEVLSNDLLRCANNFAQRVNDNYTTNNEPQIDNVEQNALIDLIGVIVEPIMNRNAENDVENMIRVYSVSADENVYRAEINPRENIIENNINVHGINQRGSGPSAGPESGMFNSLFIYFFFLFLFFLSAIPCMSLCNRLHRCERGRGAARCGRAVLTMSNAARRGWGRGQARMFPLSSRTLRFFQYNFICFSF